MCRRMTEASIPVASRSLVARRIEQLTLLATVAFIEAPLARSGASSQLWSGLKRLGTACTTSVSRAGWSLKGRRRAGILVHYVIAAVDIKRLAGNELGRVVSEEGGGDADIIDANECP
jgi:hypothetical protein